MINRITTVKGYSIICTKCGSQDVSVRLQVKFDDIPRKLYDYLGDTIKSYINNHSKGSTVEVYEEFLLCTCNRCSGVFVKDTIETRIKKSKLGKIDET